MRSCNNSLAKGLSVAKVKRLKTLLFIAVMGNGCQTLDSMKVNGRYLFVSAVHYTKKYEAFTEGARGDSSRRYLRLLGHSNNSVYPLVGRFKHQLQILRMIVDPKD